MSRSYKKTPVWAGTFRSPGVKNFFKRKANKQLRHREKYSYMPNGNKWKRTRFYDKLNDIWIIYYTKEEVFADVKKSESYCGINAQYVTHWYWWKDFTIRHAWHYISK